MQVKTNKQYHIMTYGCQMNSHQSEKIAGMLVNLGYTRQDDISKADIIAVNTCCVRESAEQKIISNIATLKKYKAVNKDLIVIVCGCLTQQNDLAKKLFKRFTFINIIIGTHNLHRISEYVTKTIETKKRIIDIVDDSGPINESVPVYRNNKPFAFVNVIYGCDNYCSYCIVPYVRGREISREPEKIIEDVQLLAEQGYKEIMLLGQNVNSYGKGLKNQINFRELLDQICKIPGIERLRFMTSHPKDISDELIDIFKEDNAVCPHIHLPFQAGSNRVLKLMNRKYDREKYLILIDKLKKANPDIAITSDIIVGFPSETEEDFLQTLDLVKRVQYDSAFTFKYSKRSGTKAAEMEDQISDEIKTDRIMRLIELQNEITYNKNKQMLNKIVNVLVEGKRDKSGQYYGKTDCFKTMNFDSEQDIVGKLVKVKVIKAMKNSLLGELL